MSNLIGEAMRQARKEARLTQIQLASVLNITHFVVNRIEKGHQPLPDILIPLLPVSVREAVIRACVKEHEAAIDTLGSMILKRRSPPAQAA